jgi:hypothetical protein
MKTVVCKLVELWLCCSRVRASLRIQYGFPENRWPKNVCELLNRVRAETQRPLPKPEPELSSVPELPEPAGTAGTQGAKHGQMHRIWHRFRPRYTSSA